MSNDDLRRNLSSKGTHALVIGNQVFVAALFADNKPFVFTRDQMEFLLALESMKAVEAAALAVGKDEIWAKAFLSSRKFKTFLSAKMQEFSVKNGLTVEWWYAYGKAVTAGKREWYEGACEFCLGTCKMSDYQAESFRQDDMTLKAECPVCFKQIHLIKKEEAFNPSREQMEAWKEFGARLIPKIERVHHQFSDEEMVFTADA
jgi:hypothetical protein